MTKLKHNQLRSRVFNGLLWGVGLFVCNIGNPLHATTTFSSYSMQDTTVTGTVLSADEQIGLPGVSITVKGTNIGTVTDFDGNFSIDIPSNDSILVVAYLGFITQEINVGDQTNLNISLESDVQSLNEVVVVGFGTQKKETLTGAITQVSGDDVLRGKGSSNAALSLQGEAPGLVITRTSSRPGNEGVDIKIRGDISVNNVSPLILLDGLEIPESELASINANDIETYSILKDGSAAIFGTKAAGGVILITTKKGKQGKMKINLRSETQMNITNDLPVASFREYAQLVIDGADNDGVNFVDSDGVLQYNQPNYRFFSRQELVDITNGDFPLAPDGYLWFTGREHYFSDNTSQVEAIYGNTFSTRHDLSISGGNENANYRTSIGYANERSPITFVYDGAKKYNFRTNVGYKVNEIVSTDFTISYDNRKIDEPTQGVGNGLQDANFFPLLNPQGQYYDDFSGQNVLSRLDEGGRTLTLQEVFRIGANVKLNFDKYVKGLSFNYLGNVTSRYRTKTYRNTSIQNYDWEGNPTSQPTSLQGSSVEVQQNRVFFQNHVMRLNYEKSFGNHNFALLGGVIAEEQENRAYLQERTNLLSDDLDDINTGNVATQTNGGNGSDNFNSGSSTVGLISFISRFNYNYDSIFLLEGLFRRDGSSRLRDGSERWANFYNVSTGLNIHELSFVEKSNIFDNLKIRASYGETGSQSGIGAVDYVSQVNTNGVAYFGATPTASSTGFIDFLIPENRSWERVINRNIGLDFALLNNRLSGTIELYNRENEGMIGRQVYPVTLLDQAPLENIGSFENTGYEFSLNWRDQIGDFKYRVGLAYWDSQSEITELAGNEAFEVGVNEPIGDNGLFQEGRPLNAIYTYQSDGLFQNENEVLEYYNQFGFEDPADRNTMKAGSLLPAYNTNNRLIPGSVRRIDANGDGEITQDDLVYFGDANPHHNFSINLNFEYKGFDFTAFLQGVGSQNIVRNGALSYPFFRWFTNQNGFWVNNTWSADNPTSTNPVSSFLNGQRNAWNYGQTNDINVIKAAYMRAKVLSLGYSLPDSIIDKMNLDRLRLSVTGNDLFVISNVNDGLDPENNTDAGRGSTIPFTSTIILGLDLTF